MSNVVNRISGLSDAKRELLARRLAQKKSRHDHGRTIPRRAEGVVAPLSFTQERLWFLDRLLPGSSLYNMAGAVRLIGPLNVELVARCFTTIIQRHEVLRTSFEAVDGRPVPVVAPHLPFTPAHIDLRAIAEADRDAEAQRLIQQEVRRPFDLAQGPLLRLLLLRVADAESIGLLTMHHIVSDGWSTKVLFQEFVACYQAFAADRPASLPDLPIQYADYALWQREQLQGEALATELAYWKAQFGDNIPVLDLPTDRPRPAAPTFNGGRHLITIAPELAQALDELSRREGVTLFMTLLTTFKLLLARYTAQESLVVGIPVAERSHPEIEGLIGCFLNMLALQTDLSGNPSFRELLHRVQQVALGAYAHQAVPFEKLVDELQPERTMSHAPLCQVAFSFEENPAESLHLQDLTMHFEEIDTGTAKLDLGLELTATHTDDGLAQLDGWIEYSTDLFDGATIARMADHFITLLQGVIANPDQPIATLPLLTEAERQQLLVTWNATATPFPDDVGIHALIEDQAQRTPDAVAVAYGARNMPYRELNTRANQLAHYLQRRGVGPETLVGVCMERSPEAVVAILGILKAGGAYVPLDPSYPAERLAFMLQDAQAPIVLTQWAMDDESPPPRGWAVDPALLDATEHATIVSLAADWPQIAQQPETNPHSDVTADNLAYVIYTSGSTGQPKGVCVAHRDLVQHTCAFIETHDLDASDRVMLFVSLSFDAAAAVLYPPLAIGATFVIPDVPSAELTGAALTTFCEQQQITVVHFPASFWHQWVDDLVARAAPFQIPFKVLLTGGESPSLAKLRTWAGLIDRPMRFLNAYGPTEAVITTTLFQTACDAETVAQLTSIPSGRPIPNKQIYLLDQHMQPVPIGVPGEVYVGGIGLARGYFNHPVATAEKFVPNLFSTQPGSRLYRTGDLARYLPDGNIEFLGRVDHQVKIRGFRIELGEIEAALAQHPAVQENAVVVRTTAAGSKRLVAYLVAAADSSGSDAPAPLSVELRAFLKERLPEHMVPAAFVELDALPLTAHGKVDERALPEPAQTAFEERHQRAPRTPVEQALAQIWAEVLEIGQVGIDDNFFELGGHSLLATQIMSRIRDAFQVELPLRRLFEGATVASLAEHVTAARESQHDAQIPSIVPVERNGALPLSFAQQRLWFLSQMEPDNPFYNMPAAVELSGPLDANALEQSLNDIIQRHETLRTVFLMADDQAVQVIEPAQPVPLPFVDLAALPAAEQTPRVRQMIAEDARQPFDLRHGPLLRCTLVRLAAQRHVFLLNMHHIVSDDWSMSVFVRELGTLYQGYVVGGAAPLSPLPIQYGDFAVWQRQWLHGDLLDSQLGYWKQQLGGSLPVLDLPFDRSRPPVQTYRGTRHPFTLAKPLTDALLALSQREGATLFMTLLAAFKTLLFRYTGQEDVLVGTPIANRNRFEIEGLIGFFLNTLVLRTDLSDNPTFRELLGRVRERTLGAYAHQDLPFEKLVEELQPERDLSRPPLFQVLFVLHNAPATALQVPGLTLTPLEVPSETALFDVTLSLTETEQGLTGWWEYNTDLFDAATLARMTAHYETLLASVVAQPEQRLRDLPLLSETAQRHLIALGTPAPTPYPSACIHDLIAAQAERTPEATAVVYAGEQLSYRELNTRANQLAHHLRRLGVGPEVLVGIYMERSLTMLVGLLGILKAGGAYVPLDPAFPQERLAFMLEDSQAPVLITAADASAFSLQPSAFTGTMVNLDTDWETISQQPETDPGGVVAGDNLAYVLYTSGSTGRPKGVQIPHSALVNFLESMRLEPGLTSDDVLVAVTTLSFDIAGLELYLPLMVGAQVVLASRAVAADGVQLQALLAESGATVMQATPATWRLLLETGWQGSDRLRVLCGGEAFPRDLAEQLLQRAPIVWNLYGPTETTIWSTVAQVQSDQGVVPIGHPLANTQIYLLDANLRPVPQGVPGELYIGGDGLARGYLGRPELTAEKFIPDPFSATPGARMYWTGDLARYRADGSIEFFGRIDHQVKIRGFRIEVGEIETVLAQHPSVQQSAVVARDLGQTPGTNTVLVAYFVAAAEATLSVEETRRFLKEKLPDYMVPAAFVKLDALPLTPNGKIDRRALPTPENLRPDLEATYVSPRNELEHTIAEIWQAVLQVERVGVNDNFFDLGGHSLLMAQVHSRLREQLPYELSMLDLFKYPTINALVRSLQPEETPAEEQPGIVRAKFRRTQGQQAETAIAIISVTGRFPGARNVTEFWQNLRDGVESISFFSEEEVRAAGVDPALLSDPNYVRANAVVDDIEQFDAGVFGMTPKEVEIMDPQHRLFLECAWEALEGAGYDSERVHKRIGVYAGIGLNTYLLNNLYSNWNDLLHYVGFHQLFVGNDKDFVPTRVSYRLNLKGPSVNVQTACSTSLVAVHQACQSLLSGESDMALAGGATIRVPQHEGYVYQEGGIPSPDGHCRAFDAEANGTIRGDGVGVVLLKRLADAVADGDQVLAVIRGTAINNDGSDKVGYTAPSVNGQAEAISEALAIADVPPETISYVETHGTGTPLGDPIEVAALTQAYRLNTAATGFCAIGSVKTNIGHLDTAAGVAGLVKTVLALNHQAIPPSLNFQQPNPKIDFAASPFYVNAQLTPWVTNGVPRRAGVSSFGIGGTNAHAIIEEAPALEPSDPAQPWQLLVLSAKTATALETATTDLAAHLQAHPDLNLADVAYTLQTGRKVFEHRRAVVCRDHADAVAVLEQRDPQRLLGEVQKAQDRPVIFLFAGQGAQYVQMARDIYEQEPVFRDHVDRCADLLALHLGLDLRDVLYPPLDAPAEVVAAQTQALNQTWLTQPALFVIEYSLAQLWMAWGLRPQAMLGHSIGEYVAACLAGVFSLEDALAVVATRGRLMQALPSGAMLAVPLPADELLPLLGADLALAAVNGARLCVVAGPEEALPALEQHLAEREITGRRLHTSHAFHSAMMEPMLEPFVEQVRQIKLNPPQLPYLSNVTGTWMTAADAQDPRYWARHVRGTVRFFEGLNEILAHPDCVLLEIGPGQTLATLSRQHPGKTAQTVVLNSLRHPNERQSDVAFMLTALGRLWMAGAGVDDAARFAHQRRWRVLLPTYPFERQRYWIEPQAQFRTNGRRASANVKLPDIADWFSVPVWKPSVAADDFDPDTLASAKAGWLLFSDTTGLAERLAARLRTLGQEVITVAAGAAYRRDDATTYTLSPGRREDYDALISDLIERGTPPQHVVHLWSVTDPAAAADAVDVETTQQRGFYSLLFLAQALGQHNLAPLDIGVVSNGMQALSGEAVLFPAKATVLGPCVVIPQEYPNLRCRSIDLALAETESPHNEQLVEPLLAEMALQSAEQVVAYRHGQRWVRTFEALPLVASEQRPRRLRERGVYLVTGGTGGLGLVLAEYLARTTRARLVLTSRSGMPERSAWAHWLATHPEHDRTTRAIRQVQALEARGAEVLVLPADVTDLAQMQDVVRQTLERFGELHGVIHAAGAINNGTIQAKTPDIAASVLRPKVQGTLVLQQALQGMKLDWLVLFSSLTSTIGGIQSVDYAAANAFLDAVAHSWAGQQGPLTLAIDWDNWQDVGMAANASASAEVQQWLDEELKKGILPEEGIAAFERILRHTLPQVLVSTRDLPARIERSTALTAGAPEGEQPPVAQPTHPRPALASAYVAPNTELEQKVAQICQAVLGLDQVGIYDNFFELGCDSLMAIQFVAQIKKELDVQISPVVLFEAPTISALVEHLRPGEETTAPDAEVAALDESDARAEARVAAAKRRSRSRRQRSEEVEG